MVAHASEREREVGEDNSIAGGHSIRQKERNEAPVKDDIKEKEGTMEWDSGFAAKGQHESEREKMDWIGGMNDLGLDDDNAQKRKRKGKKSNKRSVTF